MSTLRIVEPLLHNPLTKNPNKSHINSNKTKQIRLNLNYSCNFINNGGNFCKYKPQQWRESHTVKASSSSSSSSTETAVVESDTVLVKEEFTLNRTQKVEGKISVRLDHGKDNEKWKLIVGCDLPGKWFLHWGVNFVDDHGSFNSEWDQPPLEMRPPGSVAIKDYAIETPLEKISSPGDEKQLHELQIDFRCDSPIAAINFVLKDEESGIWCQHRGRDFKVPLMDYVQGESNIVGAKKGFSIWPGRSNIIVCNAIISCIFLFHKYAYYMVNRSFKFCRIHITVS